MPKKRQEKHSSSGGKPGRRKVLKHEVYATVCREILRILETQDTVTADDVHQRLDIPKEGMSQVAHAFRAMQMAGKIVLVEIIRTNRFGQNGNRIGVWRLGEPQLVAKSFSPTKPLIRRKSRPE